MRRLHVLYDFVPSSLSESENKLINFDIVVLKLCTKKGITQRDINMRNTPDASQKKMIYRGLALTFV
jgi:hypothetical protein